MKKYLLLIKYSFILTIGSYKIHKIAFSKGGLWEKKYPQLETLKVALKMPLVIWENRYLTQPKLFKRK